MRSISSPVPTGTVDLVITTVQRRQQRRDLPHRLVDVGQIGVTVAAARRCADSDEDRLRVGDRPKVRRRIQAGPAGRSADQLGKPRLEDRNLAALERCDPAASLSTQVTWWPKSARQAPDTRPT